MLQEWLNSLAKKAATGENEDFLAYSVRLGVPRIGEIVAGYDVSQGFSANITLAPLMSNGVMAVISPRLMVASSYSVPSEEVRTLATAMANAGQRIYNDTSRLTGIYPSPQTVSRLTVATAEGTNIFCGLRITVPTVYRMVDLIEKRGTISPELAELMIQLLMHAHSAVLAICGPGGSGKSTLLNALLMELITRSGSRMPSTVVYPGDAVDVVAPSSIPILPSLFGNPAVVMLKSCNARIVFVGEIVSEEAREVFLASRSAFRALATTVHGVIERAASFVPASVYVEMAVLGITYRVWRVGVCLEEIAPGLAVKSAGRNEILLHTVDGEKRLTVVGGFDPIKGEFWHDKELVGQLIRYAAHIGEKY